MLFRSIPLPLPPPLTPLLSSPLEGRPMRPDQCPALDLPTETRVAHACGGRFEVRDLADGAEVDLGGG
mgnify:CR=1 FL=1